MSGEHYFQQIEKREGLARFLLAALTHFREDAEAAGLTATVKALNAAVCAIDIDVSARERSN